MNKLKTINKVIKTAFEEDKINNDITTLSIVPKDLKAKAIILAKENGILAGIDIAKRVFQLLEPKIIFKKNKNDGDKIKKYQVIAEIQGNARTILTGERTALNILQRLSGIATKTFKFVERAGKIKILDTRKTTPGLRELEKYAVSVGGGINHRYDLQEAVLIKDNHIEIAGSVTEAVKRAESTHKNIEVEVKNIKEVKEALKTKANRLLLDNMNIRQMRNAVKLVKKKPGITTEISGGVNLKRLKNIATTGADYASVGALTHAIKSLDISLEIQKSLC